MSRIGNYTHGTEKLMEVAKQALTMKFYNHITKLPLSKFIDCLVDNDLSALVIEGDVPANLLEDAWSDIQQQYSEALSSTEEKVYLNSYKEVHKLQITLSQIQLLVGVLEKTYVPQFAKELNRLVKAHFVFNPDKKEDYDKNLQRCLSRTKGISQTLELKQKQFEVIHNKFQSKGASKPTREYFISYLAALSNHAGYQIKDDITVFEYTVRIKSMNRSFDKQQNQKRA